MKKIIILLGIISIGLNVPSLAKTHKKHGIKKTKTAIASETLHLKVGEEKTISFKSLTTAGYAWTYVIKDAAIVSIEKKANTEKMPTDRVGISPDELFTIKSLAKGKTMVTFKQARSWEKNTPASSTKNMLIDVAE